MYVKKLNLLVNIFYNNNLCWTIYLLDLGKGAVAFTFYLTVLFHQCLIVRNTPQAAVQMEKHLLFKSSRRGEAPII